MNKIDSQYIYFKRDVKETQFKGKKKAALGGFGEEH